MILSEKHYLSTLEVLGNIWDHKDEKCKGFNRCKYNYSLYYTYAFIMRTLGI